jgi:hypothetical protein
MAQLQCRSRHLRPFVLRVGVAQGTWAEARLRARCVHYDLLDAPRAESPPRGEYLATQVDPQVGEQRGEAEDKREHH